MRVGRPVRESNLEGMMEESARVMRVRRVGDLVSTGVPAGFLSESSWLVSCEVEGLGVMDAATSLGANSVLVVGAGMGGGRSGRARVGGSLGCCCKTPGLSGGFWTCTLVLGSGADALGVLDACDEGGCGWRSASTWGLMLRDTLLKGCEGGGGSVTL